MTELIIYIANDLERFDVHITFKTEDSSHPGEKIERESSGAAKEPGNRKRCEEINHFKYTRYIL